jgi:proline dehydrogenase
MFNKAIASLLPLMPSRLVWIFSKRYIAGEKLENAVSVIKEFNANGYRASIDLLGEHFALTEQINSCKNEYLKIIEEVANDKLEATISLKPTMFGLLSDSNRCYLSIQEIVKKAASRNCFIRIDMEDSKCTDLEIDIFKKLLIKFPDNVGLVLQSYLKRTLDDLKMLHSFNNKRLPLNIRLCKGIYIESEKIAYKKHDEINNQFLKDLEYMFQNEFYCAIATHDKELTEGSLQLINKYNVPKSLYEFQMLYGVTPELRTSIANAGHPMRIYVPYGKNWFNYCTRRLKENPRIMSHLIKALFYKG